MRSLAISLFAAVLAVGAFVSGAQAGTVLHACNISQVTLSTDCVGFLGENDSEGFMNTNKVFNVEDWKQADKENTNVDTDLTPPVINLVMTGAGTSEGTWEAVGGFGGYTTVALILKAGNAFVAYLLDVTQTSGSWTTAGVLTNERGNAKDISHISLYYSEGSLSTVPLPAALPLYAAGVVLLGLFGWKRRKA